MLGKHQRSHRKAGPPWSSRARLYARAGPPPLEIKVTEGNVISQRCFVARLATTWILHPCFPEFPAWVPAPYQEAQCRQRELPAQDPAWAEGPGSATPR